MDQEPAYFFPTCPGPISSLSDDLNLMATGKEAMGKPLGGSFIPSGEWIKLRRDHQNTKRSVHGLSWDSSK
jgi:hypothetical protein